MNTNTSTPLSAGKTILEEAQALVYKDRQQDYGSVSDNFNTIAKLWSVVLKTEVTAQQVALCMVQVKVARQLYKPKRDNLVDGAGYFATIEKMNDEQIAAERRGARSHFEKIREAIEKLNNSTK